MSRKQGRAKRTLQRSPDGYIEAEVCKELSGRIPRLRLKEEMADKLGRFSWRYKIAPTLPD